MADADAQLTLAMPVGLPAADVDAASFFADLANRIEAQVSATGVSVWSDADALYSGLYPMVKAAVWYVPAGSAGLDGGPVSSPTLYCRTWPLEYLSLRASTGGGDTALPAVIGYGSVDPAEVELAIASELVSNEQYAHLTDAERTTTVSDFMAGNARLLVEAGHRIGMGQVDGSRADGDRRVDIILSGTTDLPLPPAFYWSLWATVGGELVTGHPLIALVQGPVSPAMAPIEGGIRVKLSGEGLTNTTPVSFGGVAATAARASADGTAIYVDAPAGAAGTVDVVVGTTTHSAAFAYTEDVVATAQAALTSQILYLGELAALASAGSLDDDTRLRLGIELDHAGIVAGGAIERRSSATGAPAIDPAVADLIAAALPALTSLDASARAAIG
jgi:hypothetical protein